MSLSTLAGFTVRTATLLLAMVRRFPVTAALRGPSARASLAPAELARARPARRDGRRALDSLLPAPPSAPDAPRTRYYARWRRSPRHRRRCAAPETGARPRARNRP